MELFGSTYTGFALKDSDINMNLRFRDRSVSDPVSMLSVDICDATHCVCACVCLYVMSVCNMCM